MAGSKPFFVLLMCCNYYFDEKRFFEHVHATEISWIWERKNLFSFEVILSVRSYVDTEDPYTVFWLRIIFYVTQVTSLIVYVGLFCYLTFTEIQDEKKIKVMKSDLTQNGFLLDEEDK